MNQRWCYGSPCWRNEEETSWSAYDDWLRVRRYRVRPQEATSPGQHRAIHGGFYQKPGVERLLKPHQVRERRQKQVSSRMEVAETRSRKRAGAGLLECTEGNFFSELRGFHDFSACF